MDDFDYRTHTNSNATSNPATMPSKESAPRTFDDELATIFFTLVIDQFKITARVNKV
jgi:hypothetical protein